jgi:inner membrane protein
MNIITHALVGWALATAIPDLSRQEKSWVVAFSVAPDLDGLGLFAEAATRSSTSPLFWWSEYHHLLLHNLLFALLLSFAAAALTRRVLLGIAVFGSVNLHFLCDLAGSRGPNGYPWPLYYLWPFSDRPALTVPWQWQLNAWPNVVISLVLLGYMFWLARKRGTSPLELVSARANGAFVAALRQRFPPTT